MKSPEQSSCCCRTIGGSDQVCRVCGNPGTAVTGTTVASLVTAARQGRLPSPDGFSFCPTPGCPVVYYSNERNEYIEKEDVTVRVGVKETDDPAPLCYCFGWTKKMVDDEVARTGTGRAVGEITERIGTAGCACERNNPSGRCCLQDVQAYTALAQERGGNR